jgi:adenylate cyclase class IV
MPFERELKITEIDKDEAIGRLKEVGAKYVGTYTLRRVISIPKQGKNGESWFRVRSDGSMHVLTFKQKRGNRLAQEKYEAIVKDPAKYLNIFLKSPNKLLYFASKRIEYNMRGNKVTIDKWPKLPWSMEVEGKNRKAIVDILKELNLKKGRPLGNMSGRKGYEIYGLDYEKVGDAKISQIQKLFNTKNSKSQIHMDLKKFSMS